MLDKPIGLAMDSVRNLLEFIGEDPEREGLKDTPRRVIKSYQEIFYGYDYSDEDIREVLTIFEDGACDEMILLKDIDFVSFCEHHMLPFTGVAHIAYIPRGKVAGISKLARILDIYAHRLQIQERLTQEVANALFRHLLPKGTACVIEAHHTCMSCRGVLKKNTVMVTSSLTGVFMTDCGIRSELMSLIKG